MAKAQNTRAKKKLTLAEKRQNKIDRFHQSFLALTTGSIFNKGGTGLAPLFQRLVRLQAADEHGMCECISCGVRQPWNTMDSGHFVGRNNKATILDPDNCHPQCKNCNQWLNGNVAEFRKALVKKVGERRVLELERMKLPKNHVWPRYQLAEIKVDLLAEIKLHEKRLGVR